MTLWQSELYKEYHNNVNVWDRYEIGREIVKANRASPVPLYWKNDYDSTLPGELWKPINVPYFTDYLQVSDHGRIKRLQRNVGYRNGNPKNWPEKILIPNEKSNGRLRGKFHVGGNALAITLHRAVGLTFITNTLNKSCINHIDGDPKNCHYLNLEWATYSENELHSIYVLGKQSNQGTGVLNSMYKGPIRCMTNSGQLVKEYECASDVKKDGFYPSHVYRVANGIRKTTGGYIWQWV